jgi:anti-sigma factor RsiW
VNDLTCKQLVELMTDYLEGTLPETERSHFEAHLSACGGCSTYLEQIVQTIRLTGMLSAQGIPPHEKERLLRALRDWKHSGGESE